MRKIYTTLFTVAFIALAVNAMAQDQKWDKNAFKDIEVKWYGGDPKDKKGNYNEGLYNADKAVKKDIGFVENTSRKNASGDKITSNAHSADFPGLYFIWDSKQKDNGYLKVAAEVFDVYESFILTSKESNKYFDFTIKVQEDQELTADNCYVFYIPKVYNNKNINMVFFGGCVVKEPAPEPVVVNLGFIGYYLFEGNVLTTSIHWQKLEKEGEMIDWDAVDAAYDAWVAQGGLAPKREGWQTSGFASFTFEDYAALGYGDFNIGQLESYYKAYYVDPGYILPEEPEEKVVANLIFQANFALAANPNAGWWGNLFTMQITLGEETDLDWADIFAKYNAANSAGRFANYWWSDDRVINWYTSTGGANAGRMTLVQENGEWPTPVIFTKEMFEIQTTGTNNQITITIRPTLVPIDTRNIEVFEHKSGNQYGYVGMSYTEPASNPIQRIELAGSGYSYEIVSRKPWPAGTNNETGVLLPVIGVQNPVFNVLGNNTVEGQQTMARTGNYIVEATNKATGKLEIVFFIKINPAVQDRQ